MSVSLSRIKKASIALLILSLGVSYGIDVFAATTVVKTSTIKTPSASKTSVKTQVKPQSTSTSKTSPVVNPTTATPPVQSVAPVVSSPVMPTYTESADKVALLRGYLMFRDQFVNYTLAISDSSGDCGIYVTAWNNYFKPYLEGFSSYAQSQKADYILYSLSQDVSNVKTYLNTYKKACLNNFQDPILASVPSLGSFDSTKLSSYRAMLLEDFSYSSIDMMPTITYGADCTVFKDEQWKFMYKPRFARYREVASSLGLTAELEYFKNYQNTLSKYSKFVCSQELSF